MSWISDVYTMLYLEPMLGPLAMRANPAIKNAIEARVIPGFV